VIQAQPYHKSLSERDDDVGTSDLAAWFRRLAVEAIDGNLSTTDKLKPAAPRKRKQSIDRLIKQAERSGKRVTSITTADGATLRFDEPKPEPKLEPSTSPNNPWDEVLPREPH
jgi:hypothetical protein